MRLIRKPYLLESAEEAVARSAGVLDRIQDGWYREITPDQLRRLDQSNPFSCVLHLSFGCYQRGITRIREAGLRTTSSTWAFHPPHGKRQAVDEAWRWEIESRQVGEQVQRSA